MAVPGQCCKPTISDQRLELEYEANNTGNYAKGGRGRGRRLNTVKTAEKASLTLTAWTHGSFGTMEYKPLGEVTPTKSVIKRRLETGSGRAIKNAMMYFRRWPVHISTTESQSKH